MKVCFLLLLTVLAVSTAATGEENLLVNGDFEHAGPEDAFPVGWSAGFFREGAVFRVTTDKKQGGRQALVIRAETENDARLTQTIEVKPHTCYRLSGWIAAEDVTEGKVGANLCVVDRGFHHSPCLNGNAGWTFVELDFRTHDGQQEVTIGARLGMWGNTVKGTAYFDDLRLVELTEAPASYRQLEPDTPPAAPPQEKPGLGTVTRGWVWLALPALFVVILLVFLENRKAR